MTQRIFDVENAEDMRDLWDRLPDDVTKLTPRDTFCLTSDAYTFIGGIIKIDFHDKDEITRPMEEATEADLGKLCYFWDNCCEDIIIGKLTVVERNKGHTYYRLGNYAVFDHCRRLTKQEIEELI